MVVVLVMAVQTYGHNKLLSSGELFKQASARRFAKLTVDVMCGARASNACTRAPMCIRLSHRLRIRNTDPASQMHTPTSTPPFHSRQIKN